jgi:pimeloyl-ACP methyl ester carboxylesterase
VGSPRGATPRDARRRGARRLALARRLDDLAYASLLLWSDAFLPVAADRISPLERAADLPRGLPVHLLAGADDEHTRVAEVEALREHIGAAARLVVIAGAAQARLWSADQARYEQRVVEFLGEI